MGAEPKKVAVSADDVWGSFTWKARPECHCGHLAQAVEAGLIFVSPTFAQDTDIESNLFYMLPVSGDGFFALDEGVSIACCPWCGDRIKGLRGPAPG
jgi:hypothetical protein